MAKFKVGDVVRVRDDVGGNYTLRIRAGKTVTIAEVFGKETYRINEHPEGYWGEEMFYDCVVKPSPAPEPEFKPGDRVKVAYEGKIVRGPDGDGDYLIEVMGLSDYVPPQYITKIKVDDDTSGLLNPRRKGLAEVTD